MKSFVEEEVGNKYFPIRSRVDELLKCDHDVLAIAGSHIAFN